MQIEEITKSIEMVNGDKLYLLDIEKLDNIEKGQVINDVRIGGGVCQESCRIYIIFLLRQLFFI